MSSVYILPLNGVIVRLVIVLIYVELKRKKNN